MIPFRDNFRSKTMPFVTVSLIVVNSLIFLYELSLGSDLQAFLFRFGVVPNDVFPWPASGQSFASITIPYVTSIGSSGTTWKTAWPGFLVDSKVDLRGIEPLTS